MLASGAFHELALLKAGEQAAVSSVTGGRPRYRQCIAEE